jgi:cell division protein FtsX
MSDTSPTAVPPRAPAARSTPWLNWVVLLAVAVAAMLCGAGAATAVTVLVLRNDQAPQTHRYEVRALLEADATTEEKAAVESTLSTLYPGGTIRVESRDEAYQRFREVFKDDAELLNTVQPSDLSESLLLTTEAKTPFDCAALSPVERTDGVDAVRVRQLGAGGRPTAIVMDCP